MLEQFPHFGILLGFVNASTKSLNFFVSFRILVAPLIEGRGFGLVLDIRIGLLAIQFQPFALDFHALGDVLAAPETSDFTVDSFQSAKVPVHFVVDFALASVEGGGVTVGYDGGQRVRQFATGFGGQFSGVGFLFAGAGQ